MSVLGRIKNPTRSACSSIRSDRRERINTGAAGSLLHLYFLTSFGQFVICRSLCCGVGSDLHRTQPLLLGGCVLLCNQQNQNRARRC